MIFHRKLEHSDATLESQIVFRKLRATLLHLQIIALWRSLNETDWKNSSSKLHLSKGCAILIETVIQLYDINPKLVDAALEQIDPQSILHGVEDMISSVNCLK